MAEKRAFHRSRIFYILSAIFLVLVTIGYLIWRNYKYKLVDKKVDLLVTVKSKGLYQVSYKNLVIDEALGSILAENLDMLPDSLVYQSLIEQKNAPDNLFYIHIPRLTVTGVKTPKALLNKEISAHIIRIENAEIEIRLTEGGKEKHADIGKIIGPEMYQQILGNLKSIHADSVILENADLTLSEMDSRTIRCKASGLSLRFAGTAIDSLNNDSSRILFSRELAIHCDQFLLPAKNKVYDLQVSGFDFNTRTASIHTGRIKLKPRLSESAFANASKYAKDRLDILIGSLDIRHINRPAILRQQLIADSILLTGASFCIFRDKSRPHDSVDRTHKYPQEVIMLLPVKIYVKKIWVKDSYVEYKEKNDISDSSGKVAFFHVDAKFDNVTNMPEYIRKNNQMRLNFNAEFLNKTAFTADIAMKLNDKRGIFQLDAKMNELDAAALNPLLKPMALAELDKGKINGLRYHLNATNIRGKGKLILTYENLSIKLLKKDDKKNKYKTKLLPTMAAGIIMKESNPQHGKTRVGNVDYNRDVYRSIFNMMWKSMFAGIKQVAM
jgi:hypothetical protein